MCQELENLEQFAKTAASLSRRFPDDDPLRMNAIEAATAVTVHLMSCPKCQESEAKEKAS